MRYLTLGDVVALHQASSLVTSTQPCAPASCQMIINATVKARRLVVDEPTSLPEGTEVELLPIDPADWLDDSDRAALHKALRESGADVAAGRLIDAEEVLKEIRSR